MIVLLINHTSDIGIDEVAIYFWWYCPGGGPLEWQEGVSGSSMDTQKAP